MVDLILLDIQLNFLMGKVSGLLSECKEDIYLHKICETAKASIRKYCNQFATYTLELIIRNKIF